MLPRLKTIAGDLSTPCPREDFILSFKGRESAAIGHRDPDVLGDFDRVWVLVDNSDHDGCAPKN